MKHTILFITIIFLNLGCSKDDLESGKIFEGDITLLTQQEIDDFGNEGYTRVTGSIIIGDFVAPSTAIINLEGLTHISIIGKHLYIIHNYELTNFNGLSNLSSIGGGLTIARNDILTNLDGLSNLSSIGEDLYIGMNHVLTNFEGLSNFSSIGGGLAIARNDVLTNLDGLSNLSFIGEDLFIESNYTLRDLCGIHLVISNGFSGDYLVTDNFYNPTEQDIINGNCSQ